MRVKARAVILIDGRLIVAEQRRRGRTEHSLPGGRVKERESVLDALKREVAEETGLRCRPRAARLRLGDRRVRPQSRSRAHLPG